MLRSLLQPLRHYSFSRFRISRSLSTQSLSANTGSAATLDLPGNLGQFFTFWPSYFSKHEQKLLLSAALQRLDSMDTVKMRRLRSKHVSNLGDTDDIQNLFAPDDLYDFHEVHFMDQVFSERSIHTSVIGSLRQRYTPLQRDAPDRMAHRPYCWSVSRPRTSVCSVSSPGCSNAPLAPFIEWRNSPPCRQHIC